MPQTVVAGVALASTLCGDAAFVEPLPFCHPCMGWQPWQQVPMLDSHAAVPSAAS